MSTLIVLLVDYVGANWLRLKWPSGADLFPNAVVGYVLALFQLTAAAMLLVGVVNRIRVYRTWVSAATTIVFAVCLGAGTFVAYALIALWYHMQVMGRSI